MNISSDKHNYFCKSLKAGKLLNQEGSSHANYSEKVWLVGLLVVIYWVWAGQGKK